MSLYLAFDVGGTKTAALLADELQILARAEAGSIKTLRVSEGEARRHLERVLVDLVAPTGADLRQVRRTAIGTSGASVPAVRAWMRAAIAETVGPTELTILGDEVIALDSALPGRRGVLVIAGTGSNVVARADTGQMVHTGGWGPALSDQGSGHMIGSEALRQCFAAIDSSDPSSADYVASGAPAGGAAEFWAEPRVVDLPPLLQRIMEHARIPTLEDAIATANRPGFAPATLVPVVLAAARAGDRLAQLVLQEAGEGLAELVLKALRKLAVLEHGRELAPPPVAFVGGVLTHLSEVREAMAARLSADVPGIEVAQKPSDPLLGALWHARGRLE